MTSVISALLKPHITRLKGSSGSGTDGGRTTVSVVGGLEELVRGVWPRANGESHSDSTSGAKIRILRPAGAFKSPALPARRQKSFWPGCSKYVFPHFLR